MFLRSGRVGVLAVGTTHPYLYPCSAWRTSWPDTGFFKQGPRAPRANWGNYDVH